MLAPQLPGSLPARAREAYRIPAMPRVQMIDDPHQALSGGRVGRIEQSALHRHSRHQVEEHDSGLLVAEPTAPDRPQATQRRGDEPACIGSGDRQLHGLAGAMLRIIGAEPVGFDKHDQVSRRQPLVTHLLRRPRRIGRDGLGHFGRQQDRLAERARGDDALPVWGGILKRNARRAAQLVHRPFQHHADRYAERKSQFKLPDAL